MLSYFAKQLDEKKFQKYASQHSLKDQISFFSNDGKFFFHTFSSSAEMQNSLPLTQTSVIKLTFKFKL